MYQILFRIGKLEISTYGVLVSLGVLLSYTLATKIAQKEKINIKKFSNLLFYTVISGFIGARLLYIFTELPYFWEHPLQMVFSRSGFVFYGGIIGGLICFYILTKKYRLDLWQCIDIVSVVIPLGHFLGRLGCFSYGCCYGKVTHSWWGLKFPPYSPAGSVGEKVIPTQLIEAVFLLFLFFVLYSLYKRLKYQKGLIFFIYILSYSIFRFFIEFLRGDPRGYIGVFSTSQIISFMIVFMSLILLYIYKKKGLRR